MRQVIIGNTVDLISPFPLTEVKRIYGWNHCYRSIVSTDDTPNSQEDFLTHMEQMLPQCVSYGVIDKNHLTNDKHPAPLVGVIIYEPSSLRSGYFHVATARKAWRTGLIDEAGALAIADVFEHIPTLTRVGAYMLEKNFPARGLCKRLGFRQEGLIEDLVVQDGQPANVIYFGLTRRNWICQQPQSDQPLELVERSSEPLVEVNPK